MSRAPPRIKRVVLQLVCAVLLLAQQLAFTHAIWHAAHEAPAQALDGHDHSGDAGESSSLCGLHAAMGQVLGAGPLACLSFAAESPALEAPAHSAATQKTLEALTPRSRGPPHSLL